MNLGGGQVVNKQSMMPSSSGASWRSTTGCGGGGDGGVPDRFPAGLLVLVVDDDPTCLMILEKMLRNCNYEVTKCNSAEVALSFLREYKNGFDVVLSDVHMPDMDGFKLLEHIGIEMDLPVIIMSADNSKSAVMKCVTHGACDYLVKPVRIKVLCNIWRHVVRKRKHEWKDFEPSTSVAALGRSNNSNIKMSSLKFFEYLRIRLEDIKLATNNFGANNFISRGGFRKVYKGELVHSGRRVMVAVKRLDPTLGQGAPEFWKEIMMLSRYKHENLVFLFGFSDEGGENILVYEYLPNKSLDMHLSSSNLSWIERLNICVGAARGLEHLHNHSGTTQRVLHCDIKSSNILLDTNWNAKISDFGLSKFGPVNQEFTFLISHAAGTFGYCDPLYVDTGFLTKESDVYSFGVVLFEVLCGRRCIADYNDNRRFLSKLAQSCYEEKKIGTIVLDCLQEQISPCCLDKFSTIAYQCLRGDRNERPPIAEIVKQLKTVLRCQRLS